MAQIIKEITVDVAKKNLFQAIVAKQNDTNSRFLKVTLCNEGEKINVSNNNSVIINAERADGSSSGFVGEVNSDGTVTVPLTSWMLALDDVVKCSISIIDTNEQKLTSTSFSVDVESAEISNGNINEDENYDILVSLISDCTVATQVCGAVTGEARDVITAAREAAESADDAAAAALLSGEAADTAAAYANSAGNNATAATTVANNAAKTAHDAAVLASDNAALAAAAAERAETAADDLEGAAEGIYDKIFSVQESFMSAAGYAVYRRKMFMPLTNEVTVDLKLTPSDVYANTKGFVMFTYNAGKEYTGTFTVRTGNAGSQYEYTGIRLGKLTEIVFPNAYAPTFVYKASESFPSGAVDMTVIYPKDITSSVLASEAAIGDLQQKIGGAIIEDGENEVSYLARLKLYGGEPYLEYTEL